ncbi:unnamed protein product [Rotaria sp. Silwood2]|nr:unnamed protein product [Rotaria sp. Silwood2]
MSFFSRLFKFRIFKFRTTLSEELDDLHSELTHLQQTLIQTRLRQQRWTKWFAIYAILAFLIVNISYYTFFLPQDFITQIYSFLISITIGILLYCIHWIIRWYFQEKLELFKERKQELVRVYERISYIDHIIFIDRRNQHSRTSLKPTISSAEKPPVSVVSPNPGSFENDNQLLQTPIREGSTRLAAGVTPGKLPRTILPPQRTFWGTILDTIVGDGPSKRYALICKSCNSHNGMALEEEFEYLSFRCAYCNYFNGARKHKPVFNSDLFSTNQTQNENNIERMEISATDSSDSTDPVNESRITRRSIRVPIANKNEIRSRSISVDNKRQRNPEISSSEENLSEKNK